MNFKLYYYMPLAISLSAYFGISAEAFSIPKAQIDQIKAEVKKITPGIVKLGQPKIPNTFAKDMDAISQILNNKDLSASNVESILEKLSKLKSSLQKLDPTTKILIQKVPGRMTEQPLENFLETTFRKITSDLQLILIKNKEITNSLPADKITLLNESFKPIFWGFYNLFAHSYYQYLDTLRQILHFNVDKEKLILIKDIMELLLNDLNDENPTQTMTLETASYQKFNLTLSDFKELIKKYIHTLNSLIK